MAEKNLKKCSTSLMISEMQIKATLSFHFTPVRMAKIKKTQWTAEAGEYVEKRSTHPLLVGLQAGTTSLDVSLVVPQKIGHSTT